MSDTRYFRERYQHAIHFTIILTLCIFGIVLIAIVQSQFHDISLHQLSPALCATMAVKLSDCLPKKHHKLGGLSPYFGNPFLSKYLTNYAPDLASFWISNLRVLAVGSERETNSLDFGKGSDSFKSPSCAKAHAAEDKESYAKIEQSGERRDYRGRSDWGVKEKIGACAEKASTNPCKQSRNTS